MQKSIEPHEHTYRHYDNPTQGFCVAVNLCVCRSSSSGDEGEDQEEVKGKRLPKVGAGSGG